MRRRRRDRSSRRAAAPSRSTAKREVDRAEQAQSRPEVIELEGLAHVDNRERDEPPERDHLLYDLELAKRQRGQADPVRRNLQQVLEQRDEPGGERGDPPRLAL